MIVLTKDSVCCFCGMIDDRQEVLVPGGLSDPDVTAHQKCIDRKTPEEIEAKKSEVIGNDIRRGEEYDRLSNEVWAEIYRRQK